MSITKLIRPYFMRSLRRTLQADLSPEQTQRTQLKTMIETARHTEWGRANNFSRLRSYEDFRQCIDVTPYEDLRPYIMRMIAGEKNILWPGATRRFAQSSGTSDGKSKYIPITAEALRVNHYRGGSDVVAHYLDLYPDSRLFSGKAFILGGSFANELGAAAAKGVRVGDLSANLIEAINPIVNFARIPAKKIALLPDWHEKLPALVNAALKADVTNISGVPSWFLTVLNHILQASGARQIHDIWPNLEVFFHGGISFLPYRSQYDAIIDPSRMRYLETFNASEGFFAVQDTTGSKAMKLLIDAGVFYEFIPVDNPSANPIPAWEVEQGKIYAMVITACNGLWRYPIGDTVRIESTAPLRITIAGRTKHFINAFGEEVMVHNTDAAIARASKMCDCRVANYTAAPVFASSESKGHHQWLIEFAAPPADLPAFEATLDRCLADENSDYQAKRSGDIFLSQLTVTVAREGLFDSWLESTGKLGGQRKVPRLSNDRTLIESMLRFNESQ